jgi:hypothetical protein
MQYQAHESRNEVNGWRTRQAEIRGKWHRLLVLRTPSNHITFWLVTKDKRSPRRLCPFCIRRHLTRFDFSSFFNGGEEPFVRAIF